MKGEIDILDIISGIIASVLDTKDNSPPVEKLTQLFGEIYRPRWAAWFTYNGEEGKLYCTSLWSLQSSIPDDFREIPYLEMEDYPFLFKKCKEGSPFVIDRNTLTEEAGSLALIMKKIKTERTVITPVSQYGEFKGFFGLDPGHRREIEKERGRRGMSLLSGILSVILQHEKDVGEYERLENHLSQTLTALGVYPYSFDFTRGRITNLDFWCEMTGYCREELEPRLLGIPTSFFFKGDFTRLLSQIRKLHYKESDEFQDDFQIKTRGKGYCWYRCIVKVTTRKESGLPNSIIGLIYDIHERKTLELETERQTAMLLDREKRLSHMAANSSDILLETDREGRVLSVNRRFTEVTGLDADSSLDLSRIIHPGDNLARFLKSCRNGTPPESPDDQLRLRTTEHGYRWYEWRVTPLMEKNEVEGFIATGRDITVQRTREERQEYQLTHDVLTGLFNRNYLAERIKERAHEEGRKMVCLYLNVDDFREINEIYGHSTADEYLIQLGHKLMSLCRGTSAAARVSGDEFVIFWDDEFKDDLFKQFIQAPLARLNGTALHCSGISLPLSFTVGYALYPEDAEHMDQLIPFAETAMIQAKMEERGSIKRFDRDLYLSNLYKREILTDVKMADITKEFELYYQPIVNIEDPEEHLMEALIRWNHPTKGFLMPGRFIDALEESGQIAEIGITLFRKVLKQVRIWTEMDKGKIIISYNLSAASLKRQGLGLLLVEMMKEEGVRKNQIHFEITETLALNKDGVVVQNLRILRENNIKIALDDFGMHYSTLSLLDKVEFDILKVDIYFTRNIDKPIPHSVVKMIREIVNINHKECIVEGVETKEQLKKITDLGFTRIQGYYFHKPMDKDKISKLLEDSP